VRRHREVVLERAAVDDDGRCRTEADPGDGLLAAAGGLREGLVTIGSFSRRSAALACGSSSGRVLRGVRVLGAGVHLELASASGGRAGPSAACRARSAGWPRPACGPAARRRSPASARPGSRRSGRRARGRPCPRSRTILLAFTMITWSPCRGGARTSACACPRSSRAALGADAAKHEAVGVDHVPGTRDLARFGRSTYASPLPSPRGADQPGAHRPAGPLKGYGLTAIRHAPALPANSRLRNVRVTFAWQLGR
jgi:hypothetical protein